MKQIISLADHYFVGEVLTWEITRPSYSPQRSDLFDCPYGWGWPVHSIMLVCPYCRRVWASLTAEGQREHRPTPAPCSTFCASKEELFTPGSILSNLWLPEARDWDLLNRLPQILLQREARLHLEYLECLHRDPDIGSADEEEAGAYSTASSTSESPAATFASQPSESPSL